MSSQSVAYNLLDERVQRWIWSQQWDSLRNIQERAIPVVLKRDADVIISASTAGGKTEAAFLAILTKILQSKITTGYQVLYVSPLKALINDQYRRLGDMTSGMNVNVTPWHGDIDESIKKRSINNPNGILIITPESLESFLINRSHIVKYVFSSLQYVVIDELHAFIGTERGCQLQSLLYRIEQIIGVSVPRIAMSATFSDYMDVRIFLRDDNKFSCEVISDDHASSEIKLQIQEYIEGRKQEENIRESIALEIYSKLRKSNNLVFTNSRNAAEEYALTLNDLSNKNGVPNEFLVHHGNLSKDERKYVESELQKGERPVTAICTTTLELGVDIGKVSSVAQIEVAHSVAGLRQRLGRSGRRGEPAKLRIFSIDEYRDELRFNLVKNIAVIELLKEHKYEKPRINQYHFSTLIQQILSILAEFGSFYPKQGWMLLCQNGAFKNVSSTIFLKILKSLGQNEVIAQLNNGQIVIGKEGEKLLRKYDFYVAFVTQVDYDVIDSDNGHNIGVIRFIPQNGEVIILAGRRWIVVNPDEDTRKIYVKFIESGGVFNYEDSNIHTDRIITEKMREVYRSNEIYPYATRLDVLKELEACRKYCKVHQFESRPFHYYNNEHIFYTWAGDVINDTIRLMAQNALNRGFYYCNEIKIHDITEDDVRNILKHPKPSPESLASYLRRDIKKIQKYDYLLTDELLDIEYASIYIDVDGAWEVLQEAVKITS